MKKHYHWLIAAVLLVQLFLIGGIYNNLSNLFIIPVTESLKIARSKFALAVSMKGLAAFVSTFISGSLLHRYGYRKMVIFFMLTSCVGFVILATGNHVITLGVGMALLGIGDGICLKAGPPQVIRHWFHKHQGLVLGCVSAATGLGGSALCMVFSGLIEKTGWQGTFWCCAAMYAVITLLLFAVVRNRPEELGRKPYGEGQYDHKTKGKVTQKWAGYSWEQLRSRPAFYLLIFGSVLSCLCMYTLSGTIVPHLRGIGFSNDLAVSLQSAMLLLLAGTKLGFGALSDRIGGKRIAIICMGFIALSLGIMAVTRNFYAVIAAVVLLACGMPLTILVPPLLVPDLFGYKAQTMAVGILMSTASLASMVASPISNAVFDRLGTYRPVYAVSAVLLVFLMGLYGIIYLMVSRDKKKLCI